PLLVQAAGQAGDAGLTAHRAHPRAHSGRVGDKIMLELKTVQTPHVPVRYYEGGEGPALVYLHGAGGIMSGEDPFPTFLAQNHHVYAPLVPGYGDSEECPEIRDMLDFTLHSWDVVEALGL